MQQNFKTLKPIGIFDSGIGGLTIAEAIVKALPHENIVYFGDTAHLPYGDKSAATIQSYVVKIADMLLQQECKLILIACYTASSLAYELVKDYVGEKAIVVNVIDPMLSVLKKDYAKKHIGLIGTRQTVNSNVYKRKIDDLHAGITLTAHATNLLASAIEEFGNQPVINELLKVYLAHPDLQHVDALLLACTHYPIVKQKIRDYYQQKMTVIDPAESVASYVKKKLADANLLNTGSSASKRFYVSDYTESFANNAKLFFTDDILLEHYPLWD